MSEDDLIYEGLEFIKAHPTATRRRIEQHLWAELDGHDRESRDDHERIMHQGAWFLLVRAIRRWYYGDRVRRAMKRIDSHLAGEKKRAKRRRQEGKDLDR